MTLTDAAIKSLMGLRAQGMARPLRRSVSDGALCRANDGHGGLSRLQRLPSEQTVADVLQQQHTLTLWQVRSVCCSSVLGVPNPMTLILTLTSCVANAGHNDHGNPARSHSFWTTLN